MEHLNRLRHCDFCGVVQVGFNRCESCGASASIIPRSANRLANGSQPQHSEPLTEASSEHHSNVIRSGDFRAPAEAARSHRWQPATKTALLVSVLFATLVYSLVALKQTRITGVTASQPTVLMVPNHNGWYLPQPSDSKRGN
jgi:hypothetical protein